MVNACIVLQKRINPTDLRIRAFSTLFQDEGYPFDELHFLMQSDSDKVKKSLQSIKEYADNLFLIADKTALPIVKAYLTGSFHDIPQSEFGNAGIYLDGKCSLFLFSADETETGMQFATNACIPYLKRKYGVQFEKLVIRAVGANESRVEDLFAKAKAMIGNQNAFCVRERKYDEDVIKILYEQNTPKKLTDDILRSFVEGLGDTLYALNDYSLEEQIVDLLKLRRRRLCVAESFTGGGIARRITSVSGASEVYFEGLNTYNELSKVKRLGVSEYTLHTSGAVSDQTAYEMASGLLRTGNCDISIATTGLAGPKSDRSALPVGLSYIAIGTKERVFVYRYKFDGTREEITEKAINYALFLVYKQLKNI